MVAYVLVAAAFLASLARYYHPPFGFTALIEFPGATHTDELPIVQSTPHYDTDRGGGYDGQFYAQLAVEPLLRDPRIDRSMDLAPYRAHRILVSWVAFAIGLGNPRWILEAYALQNVATWLLLAWLLTRWIPPVDARRFVLWATCLWSHGMLMSVRCALVDGPSVLLLALAAVAAEGNRPLVTALVLGAAGLARETNLLAGTVLTRFLRRDLRSWVKVAGCALLAAIPLLLWLDYLRSIYRSLTFVGGDHITTPLAGLGRKLSMAIAEAGRSGSVAQDGWLTLAALGALAVQSACVAYALAARPRHPWALIAAPFVLLALVTHEVVWEGSPGAFTRVFLPITVGASALVARQEHPPWWLIAGVGAGAVPGVMMFVFGWRG
jgi:hypothetical protein